MNKKGFTLVEVLSIITILSVIVLFVMPKITNSNNENKQKEYDRLVEIIENAGKAYLASHTDITAVLVDTLVRDEYLSSNIKNPFTNQNITGCVNLSIANGINEYKLYTPCNLSNVSLTVNLDGGSIATNPGGTYSLGNQISLQTPTKTDCIFSHWTIVSGNSSLSGNILTIGTTATEIKANWILESVVITYNCGEGSGSIAPLVHYQGASDTFASTGCVKPFANNMMYFLKGWATSDNTTTTTYLAGDTVPPNIAGDNLVLYAVYDDLFALTGNYEIIDDGSSNWRIKFLSSGTFLFKKNISLDAFIVAGGQDGGNIRSGTVAGKGGLGGAAITEENLSVSKNVVYNVTVGGANQSSSLCYNADCYTANTGVNNGIGICAFGEQSGNNCIYDNTSSSYYGRYGAKYDNAQYGSGTTAVGGDCYGGNVTPATVGKPNTGAGGGPGNRWDNACNDGQGTIYGFGGYGKSGGSGIVIIRNA